MIVRSFLFLLALQIHLCYANQSSSTTVLPSTIEQKEVIICPRCPITDPVSTDEKEEGVWYHVGKIFSSPMSIIILLIALVVLFTVISSCFLIVHVLLNRYWNKSTRATRQDSSGPTSVVIKGKLKKSKQTKKNKAKPIKEKTTKTTIPEFEENIIPDKPAIKKQETKPADLVASYYIPPENFTYQGPLIIAKTQKLNTEHELDDDESKRKLRSDENFKFDETLNQVYDIGSEVEIVKSSSAKTTLKSDGKNMGGERKRLSNKPSKPQRIDYFMPMDAKDKPNGSLSESKTERESLHDGAFSSLH